MHTPTLRSTLVALGLAGGSLVACGGGSTSTSATAEKPAPPGATVAAAPAPSAASQAAALEIFAQRCVTCHGAEGKGDGPASAGLAVHPRDFTNAEWQASVTDEHLRKIIMYGGTAVGKSPMMPPNPDLMAKPDVVAALAAHVRSLKGH